jgi:hypothetical protein
MQINNLVVTGLERRIQGDPGNMSPKAVPEPKRLPPLKHPLQVSMKKTLLIAALALAVSAFPARAGHVSFGLSIGVPVTVSPPPPVYVAPAPVVVAAPAQVVYAPAPVVVAAPAPVVYAPAPVVYAPAPVTYVAAPVTYAPAPCVVGASFYIGGRHYLGPGPRWGHGCPPPHGGFHHGGFGPGRH